MINYLQNIFQRIVDRSGSLLTLVVVVLLIIFAFIVWTTFGKIKLKEGEIFTVKDELDNLEKTIAKKMNGYVSQPQLDKMVALGQKPLEAKLEKLKMERQFLLDKISIFGMIKK